jgi:hypothetical protein
LQAGFERKATIDLMARDFSRQSPGMSPTVIFQGQAAVMGRLSLGPVDRNPVLNHLSTKEKSYVAK